MTIIGSEPYEIFSSLQKLYQSLLGAQSQAGVYLTKIKVCSEFLF
jgi:hypothetical protein